MADTVSFTVTRSAWVQVATGTNGMVSTARSHPHSNYVWLREAASAPSNDLEGHAMSADNNQIVFSLSAGQSLYARAVSSDTIIHVTEE